MKKRIRLSESNLHRIINESVKRIVKQRKKLNEAEDYGWVVDSSEAREAYDFACEYFGQENLNQDIVDALSTDELAACLAFIFRMNDFREWDERNGGDFEEDDEMNESTKRVLKEGWVGEPQMSSDEIFNEIIEKYPTGKHVVFAMQKSGDSTPYGYFCDFIRDYYPVTLKQCDEICKMLKQHYNFKKFYATDK